MTRSRQEQIHLDSTPFYHCYVRCVRRAFLCGTDHFSGRNFDHRKQWLVSRLRFLSYVYAIDICAYAIMSNHYHVVLHVDKKRVAIASSLFFIVDLEEEGVLILPIPRSRASMSQAEALRVADYLPHILEAIANIQEMRHE